MKFEPYWHATAPRFDQAQSDAVQGHYDVAVIGGGFTGLNAARRLAKNGVRVALLEAAHIGAGGSGRNGGHLNNGIAHGYGAAKLHLGAERAKALYQAFDRSIDMIEELIAEEGIDCNFRRCGKLKLASKPSHAAGLKANYELIHKEVDAQTDWIERDGLRTEVGGQDFHGGVLYRKTAMMHMGRYVHGLGQACARHGVDIWEEEPLIARKKIAKGWELSTPKGKLTAERVILATNGYTGANRKAPLGYFRRRIIPVGSFIIATRPLTQAEIAATAPGNRTYVTSTNIHHYFRLSPDNRLIFGGRARFSAVSDHRSDAKSGEILQASLAQIFPHLAGIEIDYCWGGLVGMTTDRFPRMGEADGMLYALGYSGHGAQMTTLLGQALADMAMGQPNSTPLDGLKWPAIPAYDGRPWFLPFAGSWFRLKDLLS